jgi:hypothetical protein
LAQFVEFQGLQQVFFSFYGFFLVGRDLVAARHFDFFFQVQQRPDGCKQLSLVILRNRGAICRWFFYSFYLKVQQSAN